LTFTKLHKHSIRFQIINTRLVTTGVCHNRCVRFTIEIISKCATIDNYMDSSQEAYQIYAQSLPTNIMI